MTELARSEQFLMAAEQLAEAGQHQQALSALGHAIDPWGRDPPPEARRLVAHALVLTARSAVFVGPNTEMALSLCDDVIKRFPDLEETADFAREVKAWIEAPE